jgi:hypothetical protein
LIKDYLTVTDEGKQVLSYLYFNKYFISNNNNNNIYLTAIGFSPGGSGF